MPLDPIAFKPYANPDDFIREVTDFIWVERAIGFIRENYEPDSIVHTGYGTITTREEVITGSLMRQAGVGAVRIGQIITARVSGSEGADLIADVLDVAP